MKLAVRFVALAVLIALAGCATHTTSTGRETTILGGAVTVASGSFQPTPATTIDADTSKIVGTGPSGGKVSLLWGLITLHDY